MAATAGAHLRKFREKHGIGLRAAAGQLGCKHPTLNAWEKGHRVPEPAFRRAIGVWTKGAVAEDDWELSDSELAAEEAAARVKPFDQGSAA